MIFDAALTSIDSGKAGLNKGLSLGLPKLSEFIPDLQPGNIIVIGGETGSAKSTLAINNFLYNPYEDFIKNHKDTMNFKAFIWSCEMAKNVLGTRAISRKLYNDHRILVDVNYVLSRGKNRIADEVYNKVCDYKDYFSEMADYIEVLGTDNPTGIRARLLECVKDSGKIIYKKVQTENGPIDVFDKYIPHKESNMIIGMVDHIGIIKSEQGFNKKQKIDKLIEYQIALRDMFGVTSIDVQQLNRSISSTDRVKLGSVEPQLSDFKESSDSTDSANYVLAIFSPQRYEISPYRGYTINKKQGGLGDRFRSIKLLKSRDGAADIIVGSSLLGECGLIRELPKSEDMTKGQDWYKVINAKQKQSDEQ